MYVWVSMYITYIYIYYWFISPSLSLSLSLALISLTLNFHHACLTLTSVMETTAQPIELCFRTVTTSPTLRPQTNRGRYSNLNDYYVLSDHLMSAGIVLIV